DAICRVEDVLESSRADRRAFRQFEPQRFENIFAGNLESDPLRTRPFIKRRYSVNVRQRCNGDGVVARVSTEFSDQIEDRSGKRGGSLRLRSRRWSRLRYPRFQIAPQGFECRRRSIFSSNRRQGHSPNAHLLDGAGIGHLRREEELGILQGPLTDVTVQGLASVDHAEKGRHLRFHSSRTNVLDEPRECPQRQHGWNRRDQDQISRSKDVLTQYREARGTIEQQVVISVTDFLEHFSKVTIGPAQLEEQVELTISEVGGQEVQVVVVRGFDRFSQRIDSLKRLISKTLHLWMDAEREARRRLGI